MSSTKNVIPAEPTVKLQKAYKDKVSMAHPVGVERRGGRELERDRRRKA